eukprot:15182182-Alexandrium_andersonii.AAC.1
MVHLPQQQEGRRSDLRRSHSQQGLAPKNPDIGSSGQVWYCVCCGCKYNANYGMLVEVHRAEIGASFFF